jgi:hypothetical protein
MQAELLFEKLCELDDTHFLCMVADFRFDFVDAGSNRRSMFASGRKIERMWLTMGAKMERMMGSQQTRKDTIMLTKAADNKRECTNMVSREAVNTEF